MVIDSSALVGLLLGEPETIDFVAAIAAASSRLIGAPSYVETAIVMVARSGPESQEKLDRLLADLAIQIVPFTRDQAVLAGKYPPAKPGALEAWPLEAAGRGR